MNEIYAITEDSIPSSLRKKKKVNFFKKLMYKWVLEAGREDESQKERGLRIDHNPNKIDSDKGIRFQVYKATGGFVVETNIYDRHKDRHHQSLHIIADDQNLGEQIGKIITMEVLKQ